MRSITSSLARFLSFHGGLPVLVGLALASAFTAWAHDDPRVELRLSSSSQVAAGRARIEFELLDRLEKQALDGDALEIFHEKKLHVILFDPALETFRHEHAEFASGRWSVEAELPVSGVFQLWAEGKILWDGAEFAASSRLEVVGGAPAIPSPEALGDARQGASGNSVVTLSGQNVWAGKTANIDATFSRADGSAPEITPYIGQLAHLVSSRLGGEEYLHIHAMDHGVPDQVMVHAVFPEPGDYRIWVQFIDAKELKVIPLSVRVLAKP